MSGHPELSHPVTPRRRNAQPEHCLSHWCGQLLERIMVEPCWFTAIDHSAKAIGGEDKEKERQAQMVWRERQKKMGIKPSHLDWYAYQVETGIFTQIELKSPQGGPGPTTGQEDTMRLLRARGIHTGWTRSIPGFYDLIVTAGFRLHPNAARICAEITERHAAAEREAAVKRETPRKAPKPRNQPRYLWPARA